VVLLAWNLWLLYVPVVVPVSGVFSRKRRGGSEMDRCQGRLDKIPKNDLACQAKGLISA